MKHRTIGLDSVGEIGLGCMGMSWAYGSPDDAESIRTLNRALELGINFWDTADVYGSGKNEELLSKVLKDRRDDVFLATKFGNVFDRAMTSHQDLVAANAPWIVDGTPEYIKKAFDQSIKRLGVDHIDLYYQHRVDDRVPIEETVGAMKELVDQGKVRYIGLSEVGVETIERARKVAPITAVQNELSLWTRDFEDDVLPYTEQNGITFVAYSPLGRGFLTGEIKKFEDLAETDGRRNMPRFQGDNFETNLKLVSVVEEIAARKCVAPAQIALAWVLAQGEHVIPIPGTKRVKWLEQNALSAGVQLTSEDLDELKSLEGTGDRYGMTGMAFLKR
ncbi:MAG: aldo/keto reductase [Armatimonadetes bacterium]|nr:aldo/keto reductase [Armatimonadota bacterium]